MLRTRWWFRKSRLQKNRYWDNTAFHKTTGNYCSQKCSPHFIKTDKIGEIHQTQTNFNGFPLKLYGIHSRPVLTEIHFKFWLVYTDSNSSFPLALKHTKGRLRNTHPTAVPRSCSSWKVELRTRLRKPGDSRTPLEDGERRPMDFSPACGFCKRNGAI